MVLFVCFLLILHDNGFTNLRFNKWRIFHGENTKTERTHREKYSNKIDVFRLFAAVFAVNSEHRVHSL